MSYIVRCLCASLLSLICAVNVYAGQSPDGYSGGQWWINTGLGAGSGSGLGGGAALLEGNYRLSEHQLISVRATKTSDFQIFSPSNEFTEVGALYGVIAKAKYGYASASAGLGWAQYKDYVTYHNFFSGGGNETTRRQNTVNIPLEIQLFTTPTPYVGIGLIGFSNINSVNVVSGAFLALQFGNLW